MSSEKPQLIDPTEANARRIQELLVQDFGRLDSISEDEVLTIADPDSEPHVERQLGNLRQSPEQYYGLVIDGTLHGVGHIGDWGYRDEELFVGRGRTLGNKALHIVKRQIDMVRRDSFEVHTGGLHAFALSDEVNTAYAKEFFDDLVSIARVIGYRSLKSAVDLEDMRLRNAFESHPHRNKARKRGAVTIKTASESSVTRQSILEHISTAS